MSSTRLETKKKQHALVTQQAHLILKQYNLTDEQLSKATKDIADVILTSWDLEVSNLDFAGTWFNQKTDSEIQN